MSAAPLLKEFCRNWTTVGAIAMLISYGIPTVAAVTPQGAFTTGTLVEIGDVDGLTSAMSNYLSEPFLCKRHGEAGRLRTSPCWH